MAIIKLGTIAPKFLVSEIEASSNDDCIPCMLTSREVTVIRQALFPVAYWRTRLGEDIGVGRFLCAEDKTVKTDFRNLVDGLDYKLSGGPAMDCFESVKEGLVAIAESITNRKCCNADVSDISVSVTPGGNVVTGDVTQGVTGEGEGDPPEGFEDWGEYFLHKCRAANAIVDGFISQLNTFSIMTVFTFVSVSVALGIFLAMSFPPAGIAILIVALVALEEARYYLGQLSDYIAANRADFVCAIYNSETAGEAIDYFLSEVDNGIEYLGLTAPIPGELRAVVNAICDAGVFSKVYDAAFEVFYPDADCSGCSAYIPDCEIEDKEPHYNATMEKISDGVFEVDLGQWSPTVFGGLFGTVNGCCTLTDFEVLSGGFNHDFLVVYVCVDGTVETIDSGEVSDGLSWLMGLLPLSGFMGIVAAYQTIDLKYRLTLADDCEFCGEGEGVDLSSEMIALNDFIIEFYGKNKSIPSKEDIADFKDSRDA